MSNSAWWRALSGRSPSPASAPVNPYENYTASELALLEMRPKRRFIHNASASAPEQMQSAVLRMWQQDAQRQNATAAALVASELTVPPIAVLSYGLVRGSGAWFEFSFSSMLRYVLEPLAGRGLLFADYNCDPPSCIAHNVRRAARRMTSGRAASVSIRVSSESWVDKWGAPLRLLHQCMCATYADDMDHGNKEARSVMQSRELMGLWGLYQTLLRVLARVEIGAVVVTRIDTFFMSPRLDDILTNRPWERPTTLFVPEVGNWGYLSDQFAYGHRNVLHTFVFERVNLIMADCRSHLGTEIMAAYIALQHNWTVRLSPARHLRVRSDWSVPVVDICSSGLGWAFDGCGDWRKSRPRKMPPLTRDVFHGSDASRCHVNTVITPARVPASTLLAEMQEPNAVARRLRLAEPCGGGSSGASSLRPPPNDDGSQCGVLPDGSSALLDERGKRLSRRVGYKEAIAIRRTERQRPIFTAIGIVTVAGALFVALRPASV